MESVEELNSLQHRVDELRSRLEKEHSFTHDVLKSAPVALVGISRGNKIQYVNRKAEQVLGKPADDLLGEDIDRFIPEAELFDSRSGSAGRFERTLSWKGCALSWKSAAMRDQNGATVGAMLYGSVFESISRRTVWSERMGAIQSFVGSLAHDLNNILGGVVGYSSLLSNMVEPDSAIFNYVEALDKTTKGLADIIEKLQRFGHCTQPNEMPFDVNYHLETFCRKWLEENPDLTISTDFAFNLQCVKADWMLIEQALDALFENAVEATPESDEIIISTEQVEVTGPSSTIINYPAPGTYVRMQIRDRGHGMDAETTAKAFIPFFSTKEKGKGTGTGLGLSIAYGIIKKHFGYLTLESGPGCGTTTSIYLPLQPVIETIDIDDSLVARGTETILIIDDEHEVTNTVSEMLGELGYSVYTANTGDEALNIYRENKSHIDLVILDMIMPDMSGEETYHSLKDIDPDVKVLLTSGFDHQWSDAEKMCDLTTTSFVSKPYRLDNLSTVIRKSIDEEPS